MHGEADLRRIAFVTRYYSDLRAGVIRAFLAPYILAAPFLMGVLWTGLHLVVIAGLVAAYALILYWTDRRFGRARPVDSRWPRLGMGACLAMYLGGSYLDTRYLLGTGLPSAAFIAVAGFGGSLCVRLWPFAPHNLLPTGLALTFSATFMHIPDVEAFPSWQTFALIWTLAAWSAAGFVDLAVLIRALPRRQETVDAF